MNKKNSPLKKSQKKNNKDLSKKNNKNINKCTKRNPEPPCKEGYMVKKTKKGANCCYKKY